jgi:hypothetical protein
MTPERRKYILDHLAKVTPGDNWIRIQTAEFDELGARDFFQGCWVEYLRDEKYFTTRVGQRGWTKEERIQLPWKITAPRGGWGGPPQRFVVTSNAAYFESNCTPTNETENTMEHHVNREEILEGLTEAKVKYQDLYTRFKDLYFGVATARLSAYVEGKIPHTSPVLPCDDKGVIGLYPEQSDRYDDMILAMQLDVRKVIEMTEGEFEAFAEHKGVDNSPTLTEAIERLERLA